MEIECPHCGRRPLEEFAYGEIPNVPTEITDPDEHNLARVFQHDNPEGPVEERWFHSFGCRRWFTVRRDTRNDELLDLNPSDGPTAT